MLDARQAPADQGTPPTRSVPLGRDGTAEDARPGLLGTLLRRVLPGILVAAAVLLGALSYAESRPDQYTSVAIVTFSPRVDRPVSADTLQVLAAKYVSYLSSPATQRRIAEETGADPRTIRDALDAEIPPATASLSVSMTLPDPDRATTLANALASAAARESIDDVNLRAEILAPAVVPREPSGPARLLIALAGVLAALAAGVLTVLLLDRVRGWADGQDARRAPTARA